MSDKFPFDEANMHFQFSNPIQLFNLICELVAIPSVTQTPGELAIANYLYELIKKFPYFKHHSNHLSLFEVGESGRQVVAALVKSRMKTKRTIIVIAHYDVVDTIEYGTYAPFAYQVRHWTEMIRSGQIPVPQSILEDLAQDDDDWYFGRGIMDMKCGLALNMHLLEQATFGHFPGNILFLALPDEERHSDGMIGASTLLIDWANRYELEYQLCIDTEPSFVSEDAHEGALVYSGSVGKLLVGILCVGKETHVESPFEGMSASQMIAGLCRTIEYHPSFRETFGDEQTPPVSCLWMRDLKTQYSVQTPFLAAAYFNVLFMHRKPEEILQQFRKLSQEAMSDFFNWLQARKHTYRNHHETQQNQVHIYTFAELLDIAKELHPEAIVQAKNILNQFNSEIDLRDKSLHYLSAIATACKSMHPMVVLFTAPPYYPSVSSAQNPLLHRVINDITHYAKTYFSIDLQQKQAFPGLSDLSYTGPCISIDEVARNMPVWKDGYSLPIEALNQLSIPVMNLGPFGKDAHKWTERLEINYSLKILPKLLQAALHAALQ